jgi:hypothetical protein
MAVTIGTLTIDKLQARSVAYDELDTRQGLAVRAWDIEGLLGPVDAAAISNAFEDWTATRDGEPDSLLAGSVGTTVLFTGSDGVRTWTDVPCWWDTAPAIERRGTRLRVSFRLIDAAASLAALLLSEERNRERGDALAPTFSSITVGGVALTIISEPEGRADGPSVTTAATGTDLIEGPLRAVRIRNIVGYGPNPGRTDFDTLLDWYDDIVTTRPTAGSWYPTSQPTAEPQGLVIAGAKTTRWVISLQLRLIA